MPANPLSQCQIRKTSSRTANRVLVSSSSSLFRQCVLRTLCERTFRGSSCAEASEDTLRDVDLTGLPPEAHSAKGGGASRDRTGDLKLAKLALSQLSYGPGLRFTPTGRATRSCGAAKDGGPGTS